MLNLKRTIAATTLVASTGIGVFLPVAAHASEAGRRNTTLALGALTAVLAAKGQWLPAVIAGAGTAVADNNWQADINARHRREDGWRDSRGNGYYGQNQRQSNRYDRDRYQNDRYQSDRYQNDQYQTDRHDNDQSWNGNDPRDNDQNWNRNGRNDNNQSWNRNGVRHSDRDNGVDQSWNPTDANDGSVQSWNSDGQSTYGQNSYGQNRYRQSRRGGR